MISDELKIKITREELTQDDLKIVLSACIAYAVKDLRQHKGYIPSPYALSEQVRTAWLMIFDSSYRMKLGDMYLSLEEMFDIIYDISDRSLIDDFRKDLGEELNCYPLHKQQET